MSVRRLDTKEEVIRRCAVAMTRIGKGDWDGAVHWLDRALDMARTAKAEAEYKGEEANNGKPH